MVPEALQGLLYLRPLNLKGRVHHGELAEAVMKARLAFCFCDDLQFRGGMRHFFNLRLPPDGGKGLPSALASGFSVLPAFSGVVPFLLDSGFYSCFLFLLCSRQCLWH